MKSSPLRNQILEILADPILASGVGRRVACDMIIDHVRDHLSTEEARERARRMLERGPRASVLEDWTEALRAGLGEP